VTSSAGFAVTESSRCAAAIASLASGVTSSTGLAMPYHATTMTPRMPLTQLKTSATMPRGVKLKRRG
jgi:hypothetical protein